MKYKEETTKEEGKRLRIEAQNTILFWRLFAIAIAGMLFTAILVTCSTTF